MTGKYLYNAFLVQLPSSQVAVQGQIRHSLSANQEVVLGRDPGCEIVLDETLYSGVSRRHAKISPINGSQAQGALPIWEICDSSANGTYVNGKRLHGCQTLQKGDRIRLDRNGPEFIFEYQISKPVVPAPKAQPVQLSDSVHLSQLFPIISTKQDLIRKAFLVPGILTVIFVVLMIAAVGRPLLFNLVLAAYLAGAAYYFVYHLCGKQKPWWVLFASALATVLILVTPLSSPFFIVFRVILPGNIFGLPEGASFPVVLITHFFGAGLLEELLKAVPVLGAYLLGGVLRSPKRERIGVLEPLDGILLAAASAVGFTLWETLGQYVPGTIKSVTMQAGEGFGELLGLQLLIPRILGYVAGHMAYSGYVGYFIGLSVLKPRRRWSILATGYLTAATLHALWNAIATSIGGYLGLVVLMLVGVVSYAFLAAAILKARKLSPNRAQNFATRVAGPSNYP